LVVSSEITILGLQTNEKQVQMKLSCNSTQRNALVDVRQADHQTQQELCFGVSREEIFADGMEYIQHQCDK